MWKRLNRAGRAAARRFYEQAQRYVRSKTRKEWAFITLSFLSGALCVILVMDLAFMPLFLRRGREIAVPDLLGKTWPEAYKTVRENKLFMITDSAVYTDSIEKNRIANQLPEPGAKVRPNRRIHVALSKGRQFVTAPDVVGKSIGEAEKMLRASGLTVTEKRTRTTRRFSSGTVLQQNPQAGTEMHSGDGVSLYYVK